MKRITVTARLSDVKALPRLAWASRNKVRWTPNGMLSGDVCMAFSGVFEDQFCDQLKAALPQRLNIVISDARAVPPMPAGWTQAMDHPALLEADQFTTLDSTDAVESAPQS